VTRSHHDLRALEVVGGVAIPGMSRTGGVPPLRPPEPSRWLKGNGATAAGISRNTCLGNLLETTTGCVQRDA